MARNLEDFVGRMTKEENAEMLRLLIEVMVDFEFREALIEHMPDDDLEELYLALEARFGDEE